MASAVRNAARHLRDATLTAVRAAGGFSRIADSGWRRRRLLILCYHGVSLADEHEWNSGLFMRPDFLRRRFEILRREGYKVLPLGEAVQRLRDDTLPARAVALTFDDGFYDFNAAAMPVLESFGYPATVYVSTYYCLDQKPIPSVTLRYLLWQARNRMLPAGTLPGQEQEADLRDEARREAIATSISTTLRDHPGGAAGQHELLGDIASRLGCDWEALLRSRIFHLMTPEEITDTARRGFDVQLHTHRHRTPLDRAAFVAEIVENRSILEGLTQTPARHFCYPNGDVADEFLPWLRDTGVDTATTTLAGLASAADDPMLIPRFVDTMGQSEVLFESWVCGARQLFPRLGA